MSIKIIDIRNILYSSNQIMSIITFELHRVIVPLGINIFLTSCRIWNINVVSFEKLTNDVHFLIKAIIFIVIIFSVIGTL